MINSKYLFLRKKYKKSTVLCCQKVGETNTFKSCKTGRIYNFLNIVEFAE